MTSCQHFREHLSADLDGESGPAGPEDSAAVLGNAYQHLESCTSCARWFADVTRINRLVRTAPAEPGPGFSAAQLDDLHRSLPQPSSSRRLRSGPWWRSLARVALALVGVAQAALGAWPLCVPHSASLDAHTGMLGAGVVHMSHEYSAWSIALGISFVVGAGWTRHLAGALPVLASFVAVLVAVSAIDLVNDNVDAGRVVSHALIVLGLGLIIVIVVADRLHPSVRPFQGVGNGQPRARGIHLPRARFPGSGHLPSGGTPEPAARHRAA